MYKRITLIICSTLLILLPLSIDTQASDELIDAPFIQQMPELPRGCEVTSLAMMLQHAGVDIDKMTLAEEIKKVPFSQDGYRGNPYDGFVGDMYSFDLPGLGVYHGPIAELAEKYLPNQIVDLTGKEVNAIYEMIDRSQPVWVITNSWYSQLPESQFYTWNTKSGEIEVTYRQHSVLVTGYDENYVYMNDPLYHEKNRKVDRKGFEDAWIQMGSQAISYVSEDTLFLDSEEHWAEKSIVYVSEKGYMSGYEPYFFGPDDPVTRSQFAEVLQRAHHDVEKKHWAHNSIMQLKEEGIIKGSDDQISIKNKKMTKKQVAMTFNRILKTRLGQFLMGIYFVDQCKDEPITRAELAVLIERFSYLIK